MRKFIVVLVIVSLMLSMGSLAIGAQEKYPTKPITWIVPFGVGGMNDVSARILAEKMKVLIGQPIIIVNKSGASGTIGLRAFLKEKPDGYTLCCLSDAALNAPLFLKTETFDMEKFKYVGSYMPQERVVFAHLGTPYKTFDEFIAYAKEHPGEVSVGCGGGQWSLEAIKSIAVKEELKLKYVLFKSGSDASAAVLGGHIDTTDTGVGTPAYQAAKEGELRILVVLGSKRIPDFPEVPNVIEKGYKFTCAREYGILLHAAVPENIRQLWEDALKEALEDPETIDRMEKIGLTPRFLSGKEWEKVAKECVTSVVDLFEYNKALK